MRVTQFRSGTCCLLPLCLVALTSLWAEATRADEPALFPQPEVAAALDVVQVPDTPTQTTTLAAFERSLQEPHSEIVPAVWSVDEHSEALSPQIQRVAYSSDPQGVEPGVAESVCSPGPVCGADNCGTAGCGVGGCGIDGCEPYCGQYCYEFLPEGLMYRSYIAGPREPRFGSVWLWEQGRGWVWETAIGGRIGLVRYGTPGSVQPQGWQFDMEGAVFPRIDPVLRSELDAVDFRAGLLLTHRSGPTAWKIGYYHLSNHLGDEFMLRNPSFPRIEYVRDSAIAGVIHNVTPDIAIYGEIGYAINALGGAKPLEFQFGAEYSPRKNADCFRGAPVAAINAHLREDFNFGGNLNAILGWQWRGPYSDRLFRVGLQYFTGKSLQYQFFDKHEDLFGFGLWCDF